MEFGATREMFPTPCRIRHKSLLRLKSGKGAHLSGAKDSAKFFELAIADDLGLTRAKYNLPDGNIIGVARTDIPGFESEVVEGLSPVGNRGQTTV